MSLSVNRDTDSPTSSDQKSKETKGVPNKHATTSTSDSANNTNSVATGNSIGIMPQQVQRQQPIPPPSEPMQYRAIGLIRGQYMPSAEQLTRGTLVSSDGALIDAVLLGRVMSLVKNHLDLAQPHLWVVYPRTRQEDGNLHVQIVGVWEPENLHRPLSTELPEAESSEVQPTPEASSELSELDDSFAFQDGYFSIRGQLIYQSKEEGKIIVKIKQSPRKESETIKFFKLTLNGFLGEKVIRHFWDLHLKLHGNTLVIEDGNDIGAIPMRRPMNSKFPNKRRQGSGKNFSNQRPIPKGDGKSVPPPKRSTPIPKPVKRGD
ncbi:MAG TPA: hypothetical protein DEG17_10565 [Cyanobacteria bacterium UBA11149]|nr:hypothetical protein [Cyanobacteria bacterium UBA11367]HBE56804.1 hypothetical protein [Cyanobacteria bacterium UBA11366]HBK64246.1 hypothetical protein [Cyanobacteria bacterium UBA11166]HBR73324.1 hypothetical protein [Cyanobacteria bacterium UBA11159]HBS72192.1 hypothetical protein [Cyanobacteria bacterium UBA11153]HBW89292.1 hypothetical protein [Cyanobacteria bacterium UBA11149]HCA95607.1 hypothetical protein [Cyanobacteria bacterium UBA9226]